MTLFVNTYKARVRVHGPSGANTVTVWAQVAASNPIHALQLLKWQFGPGNVLGVAVLV